MKSNEKLKKIIYFLIPNLLYMALFSYFYNYTYVLAGDSFEILFREIFILSLVFFVLFGIIYLILRIKLDYIKCFFLILSLILLSFEFAYTSILIWIVVILINILTFKVSDANRNKIAFFLSYVVVMLFMFNFSTSLKYYFDICDRVYDEDVKMDFNVVNNEEKPNIYWIHCDGMINLKDAKEIFKYDSEYLKNYLNTNQFYINEDATLYSGGHTIQALVSLYNPYYYDEIFEEYLNNLQNNDYTDSIISYDMMNEKRMNNELFEALKTKDYKIVSISDYNQYSSFYADYMFDYYSFQKSKEKDLDYFTAVNNTYDDIKRYTNYSHLKTLADTTFLHFITDNYTFLKHKEINYNDFNYKEYSYINDTEYWKAKAILKSLDMVYSKEKNNSIFTFIDFGINHTPWLYDLSGKVVNTNKEGFLPENFLSNYEYSTFLLVDILKYIKNNDENAIIILQSDHGIHTVPNDIIAKYIGVSSSKLWNIRESTFSAIYIPERYINGDEKYLDNPLNISRYLVNSFVGDNYQYKE